MPRVSGQYTLPPGYFAVSGEIIQPSQHNPPLEDIAQALTDSLPRDGSAGMSGNLPMGGNRITGLAAATAAGHAPRYDQVVPVTGGTFTGWIRVPEGSDSAPSVQFGSAADGINWVAGQAVRFVAGGTLLGRLNSGTSLSTSLDIVTRGSGDSRYMQQTWSLTAGDGLTGGGTGAANRTLAVNNTVVRTSRQINTGTGLTGGGNLGANRTLSLDLGGLSYSTSVMSEPRLISVDGTNTATQSRINDVTLRREFNLAGSATTITSGAGLTGGGTLANDRTVSMGTPSSITRTSTNNASGTTHTHNLPQGAFRDMMANYIVPGQIGSTCFMYRNNSNAASPGTTAAGSSLYFTDAGASTSTEGGSASGTWICCGRLPGSTAFQERKTTWMRIE